MPRSNIFSAIFLLAAAIYAILAFEVVEVPGVDQNKLKIIAQNVPFWAVTMLVTYCILDLAQGVLNIGDAAEARKELMKDIDAAKTDLQSKGLKVE